MYDTRSQLDGLRASAAAALLAPPESSAAESASGVGEGGASVDTVVQAVAAAVEALEAFEPSNAPEASLSALIQRLDPCWNRLEAARTALIGTWDARQVWAADGARSGLSWMASHTEQSRGEAGARARLSRSLRTMPVTEAAFANGTIGVAKARLLAAAARAVPEAFADNEAFLVETITALRVDQAEKTLAFFTERVLADGSGDDAERIRHEQRGVHLSSHYAGMWQLDGKLEPESGETLAAALDRRARQMFRADKAAAALDPTFPTRTAAQRRADALVELARLGLEATEDGAPANVPAITALIDVAALFDAPNDAAIVGETSRGVPVTAVQAMRFTCDAHISRVGVRSGRPASETSTDGHAPAEAAQGPGHAALRDRTEPLDAGLTRRLPNPSQRRALAVRDRGCTFPGCDTPTSWTSAHHLVHWVKDGPTDLDNLTLLCSYHHHLVHEGRWTTSGNAADGIEFHRPDGTAVQVPKGPAPPSLHRSPSG